jgi:uncharacterized sulfatase
MIGVNSGDVLPCEIATAPELLSELGYTTIGVSENGYAGAAKGIDDRFDEFIKSSPSALSEFFSIDKGLSLLKYCFQTQEHGPGPTRDLSSHANQNSFFTTDITKRKLSQASKKSDPIFCYVHYNDPHHPYLPPLAYEEEYLDDIDATVNEAKALAQRMHDRLYEWMAQGLPISSKEWNMLYAMYDATIKYTDACVGNLFDFVQDHLDNTMVVITADHGDLFGEYGLLGHHMVLHDGLIHVPMVTHGLSGVSHHADKPTQHIDLMQTLLSSVDAKTSQFQGYDIKQNSRDVAISQDLRATVDDSNTQNYQRIRKHNSEIDVSHLPKSMISSFRTTDFKLIRTEEGTRLYNLPNETDDVSSEFYHVADYLTSFAGNWMDTVGNPLDVSSKEPDLSEKTEQHLKDMGYL